MVMRVLGAGDVVVLYQLRSGLGFGRRDADRDGARGGVGQSARRCLLREYIGFRGTGWTGLKSVTNFQTRLRACDFESRRRNDSYKESLCLRCSCVDRVLESPTSNEVEEDMPFGSTMCIDGERSRMDKGRMYVYRG